MRLTNLCLAAAAAIVLWRFSQSEELTRFDWFQWGFSMLGVGAALSVLVVLAARALEPKTPDVFLFRHSDLFTNQRKARLNWKAGEFRTYLANLGFEFSNKKLPIGIGQEGHGFSQVDQIGAHYISVFPEKVDDLIAVTKTYSQYVFGRMFFSPTTRLSEGDSIGRMLLSDAFGEYFHWSFWDTALKEPQLWLGVFWEIRQRYGKKFTDELLACAAQSFLERPAAFGQYQSQTGQSIDVKQEAFTRVFYSHLHTPTKKWITKGNVGRRLLKS